jgi:hypothetical protein
MMLWMVGINEERKESMKKERNDWGVELNKYSMAFGLRLLVWMLIDCCMNEVLNVMVYCLDVDLDINLW